MARTTAALGLASLFLGAAHAQLPGEATEVHPELTTYRCSLADGCKEETNYVVLDSLAHPVHQADNDFNCGNWGEPANSTACPDQESCAKNCIMEGVDDYSTYGITTNGDALRLLQVLDGRVVSPRVYLLDSTERKYEMLSLTGNEFAFDVDATKLPCGMNSALYLSEMDPTGAESELNPGGAYYGTGYCDAQCYVTPFINGLGNLDGKGACCNEMDIWEANGRSNHVAPHPCNVDGPYLCEGAECEADGVCDKNGCAWNPYRVNVTDYYGNSADFKVDTTRPFSVITQFPADADGKLTAIHRLYVQDNKVIESYVVDAEGLPKTDSLNDEFCSATYSTKYIGLGGTTTMGDALTRGMVLALSIWWDEGGNMNWLDAGEAGPCNLDEGNPTEIVKVEPNPEVTFSRLRWGEIGSTYADASTGGGKCKKRRAAHY
ncbi:endoglucanase EG-1 [Dichotomopilus funicola]|uniref:Glucanase n=1 Tax=Dichotomopilus funicola TaxID=1934379 RepID=A0AAN6UU48_9PEZI|nr:endoglucanase EG-1 [Dichotomopilus funicola]